MEFNAEQYSKCMDEFVLRMEPIKDFRDSTVTEAMVDLCHILRIAKVEITHYESPMEEGMQKGEKLTYYQEDTYDQNRFYTIREVTGNGNVAIYHAYQQRGAGNWSKEEEHHVFVFLKLLFSFNGRANVMRIADRLTYFDKDLKIPNLAHYHRKLSEVIAKRKIGEYGAVFYNLRRFSVVNQQIGRDRGTKVMSMFAKQLQQKLGPDEVVCRVGGDNFVALFKKDNLNIVMEYLKGATVVYNEKTGDSVRVLAHAGYYMIPDDAASSNTIMDCISSAANVAKSTAGVLFMFYDDELMRKRSRAKHIEDIFPMAIDDEEFHVFYQPKIELTGNTLAGAEALCRWFHNGKIIPPNDFIPVLEQTKLVCTLDFYMLEKVCRDIRRWINEGRPVVRVSVNFSRRHMGDVYLLDNIMGIIDKYRVPHEYIEIELTETTTDVDYQELKAIVNGLYEKGISTSVDDFGMGYSSLNLIREMPWNVLKIDKSFLPTPEDQTPQKYIMLKHIISLSQEMGLETIVEGVETLEHVELLRKNDCNLAQGFYFDKPLPVDEFEKRLDSLKNKESYK